jgi:methylated-DNA-[protein]-cysteine S-methyltransferase
MDRRALSAPRPVAIGALAPAALRPGGLLVAATARGVRGIRFVRKMPAAEARRRFIADLERSGDRPGADPEAEALLARALEELEAYFRGERREFSTPLDLEGRGSPLEARVWEALRAIPYGETRSYGEVARAVRRPGAARAVGGACSRNPIPVIVPCHRVIAADGSLHGFTGGLDLKARLLSVEGREAPTPRGHGSRSRRTTT